MSVLEFHGYTVSHMNYTKNKNFIKEQRNVNLNPTLSSHKEMDGNQISVQLDVVVGSQKNKVVPFEITCSVVGYFEYRPEEDENKFGAELFIRNNCVAILYPYVRAIVANLSAFSNEFPGYNMPTINVAEALKSSEDKRN